MARIPITFTGSGIERQAPLRLDPQRLAEAFADPQAGFLLVWQSRCLVLDGAAGILNREQVGPLVADPAASVFLGQRGGRALFAVEVVAELGPGLAADSFVGLRELVAQVSEADAALLAYARAMVLWRERHRFCGLCGAPNQALEGGFVMACSRDACGHRAFPRIDPAVIVLVQRGNRCLLGRQASWPEGRLSTIAGFVEPGESLEEAVAREVHEETNIRVGDCRYLASQPWPFPAAMMIGFHAEGLTTDIRCNDGELVEARWLSREELRAGQVRLPPSASIAFRLIEAWCDAEPGPRLASLGLDSPMFRRPEAAADFRPG